MTEDHGGFSSLGPRDDYYLRLAASQSRAFLGSTGRNPSAGCVLVKNDKVVGYGCTQLGGAPHAEVVALAVAGPASSEAEAYVTLEPCCHEGKTPPCAGALIRAGIKRVIVGALDPDPRVSGGGVRALRAAGIEVSVAAPHTEYGAPEGFFRRVTTGRPLVTIKVAVTLDGYLATITGDSVWVSGERSRLYVHRLRAEHDAIMVGAGTVLKDNPALTCRISGLENRSPLRVIPSSRFCFPKHLRLFADDSVPVLLLLAEPETVPDWLPAHVRVIPCVKGEGGRPDLASILAVLAAEGVNALFVEGGGELIVSILRAGTWDRFIWLAAPKLLGIEGKRAVPVGAIRSMSDALSLSPFAGIPFYPDVCTVYRHSHQGFLTSIA